MTKKQLKDYIENYDLSFNNGKSLEEDYNELYNTCVDYMNKSQDWSIEECFNDYLDYYTAEEYAKSELENGGLVRLYYFLGNANCNNDLFKIDGYGNLEDITLNDLEVLKDDILEVLDNE